MTTSINILGYGIIKNGNGYYNVYIDRFNTLGKTYMNENFMTDAEAKNMVDKLIKSNSNDTTNCFYLGVDETPYYSAKIVSESVNFNDGVMGLFETKHDGKVNRCIVDYAKTHSMSETLGFNNKLFMGIINPTDVNKLQYEANRNYILSLFNKNKCSLTMNTLK